MSNGISFAGKRLVQKKVIWEGSNGVHWHNPIELQRIEAVLQMNTSIKIIELKTALQYPIIVFV